MHNPPFTPPQKELLAECREVGMNIAVRCTLWGMLMLAMMFWVVPALPGSANIFLTYGLGTAVIASILGVLTSIFFIWVPAHDDLIRRKDERFHKAYRWRETL